MPLKKLYATRYTLNAILSHATRYTLYAILVLFIGCASSPPKSEQPDKEFVWPPPPEIPRIKFLKQWSNEYDFGKPNKFLSFLIGKERIEWLMRPNGVAADTAGNVYVADSTRRAVFVFDLEENILRLIGRGTLTTPISLAIDNKRGIIYVSDSGSDKVYVLKKKNGDVITVLGVTEGYKNPSGIVFDEEKDRLYVSDTQNHIIRVYDGNTRQPLFTIGKKGRGDGEFNFPSYLAIDRSGRLYVVDAFNSRVQIFDPDGNFLKKFGKLGDASGFFSRPAGIGVDSEGHVYIVDTAFSNFQIFDEEGRLLLWVGNSGRQPGEFSYPTGMYIDRKDRIYVTDTFNRRIQVFQYLKEIK